VPADCLIGIDIGTQSVRALLIDRRSHLRILAFRPTPTLRPAPDRAEHDPEALWQAVLEVLREVGAQVPPGRAVAGMAVASVGESCVLLDDRGQPLANAVAWFDRRTEEDAAWLAARLSPERLFAVTGLAPDPTYTLCKLLWSRRTMPDRFAPARSMLNIADYIAFRLCGEAATDFSLASRTSCLDLADRRWSSELLDAVGLDRTLLPPIRASGTRLGTVRPGVLAATGLSGRPSVGVGAHDHVCGAFAVGGLADGILLDSMGTAEALLTSVRQPAMTPALVERGCFQGAVERDQPLFYLGATITSSGGAVEWARALFGGSLSRQALIDEAGRVPPGSNGVSYLPELAAAASSPASPAPGAAFLGLTPAKGAGEMFRAVLEGLAIAAAGIVEGMPAFAEVGKPREIIVIGGNTRNRLLLEIKASAYGRPMTINAEPEATALGAALMGGIAAGLWPDLGQALREVERQEFVVDPRPAWIPIYRELSRTAHAGLHPLPPRS